MAFSPRTVLIPLAGPGNATGSIARVEAGDADFAARRDDLDPQIADLRDWSLYTAGATALGAVRRLPLQRTRTLLAQWLWPGPPSTALSVSNGPEIMGLAAENSESAELGLALAWLMHAGQCRGRVAIATGRLSRDSGPHTAHASDVAVLPVGGIARKVEALRHSLKEQRGGAFGRDVLFFVPDKTSDGRETFQVHGGDFRALAEDFRREGVGIDVRPIATLGDATRALGISRLATTPAERRLSAALAAALAALVLVVAGYSWLNTPLNIAFAEIAVGDGTKVMSPVRANYDAGAGNFRLQKPCLGAGRLPVYIHGDSLVLRVGAPGGGRIGGVHYAVVGVSEHSGLKVFPSATFSAAVRPGDAAKAPAPPDAGPDEIGLVLPITGPEEKNKLIVLAQRVFPFDTADLRQRLEGVLAGKPQAERINAVVAYLARRYPGYLDTSFLSAKGDVSCEPY